MCLVNVMSECSKSPSGMHSWVMGKAGEECLWCKQPRKTIGRTAPEIMRQQTEKRSTVQEERYSSEALPTRKLLATHPTVKELVTKLGEYLADEKKTTKEYLLLANQLESLRQHLPEVSWGGEEWIRKFREMSTDENRHASFIETDILSTLSKLSQWPWEGFIAGVGFIDLREKNKRELFDLVQNKTNWKLPTEPIRVGSRKYADKVKEAIIYYVGGAEETSEPPKGTITITSKGYYSYIGA